MKNRRKEKLKILKSIYAATIILQLLLVIWPIVLSDLGPVSCSAVTIIPFRVNTQGWINDEYFESEHSADAFLETGILSGNYTYSNIPSGCHAIGITKCCTYGTNNHCFAMETCGAVNLYTLTGGIFNVTGTTAYREGEFYINLTTNMVKWWAENGTLITDCTLRLLQPKSDFGTSGLWPF